MLFACEKVSRPAMSVVSFESDLPKCVQPDFDRLATLVRLLRGTGYSFTTTTPATHARVNGRAGNETARTLRDVFGWSRPFARDLLRPDLFAALRDADAIEAAGELFRSGVRVSSLDDELFVHSAFPTLATDAVFFGPDTHKFVDAIKQHLAARDLPIRRAADVCTGSGAGALAIAKRAPGADVFMVDINPKALDYARVNAAVAGCPRAVPRRSDKLADVPGEFDLVVAHPPYLVDRDSRAYRHGGGALGAELSFAIVRDALGRLAPGGSLLLFTGVAMVGGEDPFRHQVAPLLSGGRWRWTYREVDPDVFGEELGYPAYADVDRIALVVLEATRRADPASRGQA